MIAGGGIQSISHMKQLQRAGASAFSIGSLFLTKPWRPTALAREWKSLQGQNSSRRPQDNEPAPR
ncbi:MAG: hypothetical protein ACP5R4_14450 [Armatimonadota bacterium]